MSKDTFKRLWTAQPTIFKILFPLYLIGTIVLGVTFVNDLSNMVSQPTQYIFEWVWVVVYNAIFIGLIIKTAKGKLK